MTQLLVDIGNTRVKWASFDAGTLTPLGCVIHSGGLPLALKSSWHQLERPQSVHIANVAGLGPLAAMQRWIHRNWGHAPIVVKTRDKIGGLQLGYDEPSRLGVDRWLAMLAVRHCSQRLSMIVDAGTATTLDVVSADGAHWGGFILPGLTTMQRLLIRHTQLKVGTRAGARQDFWGHDTLQCLNLGALEATLGMIDRSRQHLEKVTGVVPDLWMTGGGAGLLLRHLSDQPVLCRPHLVLEGLLCCSSR